MSDSRYVEIATTIAEAQSRQRSKPSVLVPTMGALHKAHLELIRVALQHAGKGGEVGGEIFVNPVKVGPGSDYEQYPRPEKAGAEFCRNAGVDLLFRPAAGKLYFEDRSTHVEEVSLSSVLGGKSET